MLDKLTEKIRQQPESFWHDVYWFTALLSLIPAIGANQLFSFVFSTSITSMFAVPRLENALGLWAFALATICLVLALASKQRGRHVAVVCFVALGLTSIGFEDNLLGDRHPIFNTLYGAIAFVFFTYFVIKGRVWSLSFALFVAVLIAVQKFSDQLAWTQILVFIITALVTSLIVETVRQNWPLLKQLGRSSSLSLLGRTLKLWWPMLILIFIGTKITDTLTNAGENAVYYTDAVQPYCYLDAIGKNAILPCPQILQLNQSQPDSSDPLQTADSEDSPDSESYIDPSWPRIADSALTRSKFDDGSDKCVYWLSRNVETQIEPEPEPRGFPCPKADPTPKYWSLSQLGFFDSWDLTVERTYDIRESQLDNRVDALEKTASDSTTATAREVKKLYDVIPQSTGMKKSSCNIFHLSCHAANIVIGEMNSAYKVARRKGEGKFDRFVDKKAGGAKATSQSLISSVEGDLQNTLDAFEQRTRSAISKVQTATNITRQLLMLWLIVIGTKSFLFVFARVIFDQSTDINVDVLEHSGATQQGTVKQLQEIDIESDYPHTLYYKANYQPLGPAPRFSIPQWRASILSRLRYGAWNMSQIRMPLKDDNRLSFNSIEGEHLVDWTLKEGEEVVFGYRNFVAMNDNIELRTVISLRVATLLLGRIVFHTAHCKSGEGRLILRTRGKPATAEQVRQSIPVARLVAWNRYAKFSVDSHLTTADIFLNGFNLRRTHSDTADSPQGILIVEADARDGGILIGTLRFAKTFLLPV